MAIGLTNKRMLTNATFHTGCEKDKRGASRRLLLAALAGALVLTGCISAPKDKSSKLAIDSPGAWKSDAAKGNFEPQNWTKDFNDPQLIKIVEEALEHNYNLKAAASRLDSQIAGSRFAGSSIWPSLTGSGKL